MSIWRFGYAVVVILGWASLSKAQPNYFWNGTTGSYNDSTHWSFGVTTPAGPPAAGDRALFLSGSSFTVSGDGTASQFTVQGSDANFAGTLSAVGGVTGFPSLITGFEVGVSAFGKATFAGEDAGLQSTVPIAIGTSNTGELVFSDGAIGSSQAVAGSAAIVVGQNFTGNGALTITGNNSSFTSTGSFDLGGNGVGLVTVSANGHLNTNGSLALGQAGLNIAVGANSQAILNISDGGSVHNELQTNLGLGGKGTLNISSGSFTTTDGGTANPALSIARFNNSEGNLNVSGTGHVVTQGEIIVGGGGLGRMVVTDQGLVESFVTVGAPAIVGFGLFADGKAIIDGPEARWNITDALVVGQSGLGQLELVNGGTVYVEATDSGDPYILIGDASGSLGEVFVSDELSFLDASFIPATLGWQAGSEGLLTVSELGAAFLQRTVVGHQGFGDIYVTTGGVLATGTAVVGELSDGSGYVTVDSEGSWEILGQLLIGVEGTGEVFIGDGSTLSVDELISIGEGVDGYGALWIDGPTAVVEGAYGSVTIGFLGEGELYLSSDATWNVPVDVAMGVLADGRGAASVPLGTAWNIAGKLSVGGSDVAAGGAGEIEIGGVIAVDTVVKVWDGGEITLVAGGVLEAASVELHGTLRGTGTIDALVAINDGVISPRQQILDMGRVTFTGDYEQTEAGVLDIQIGGYIPQTEFDQIVVNGIASLQGELHVELADIGFGMFAPELDDEFVILSVGEFDAAQGQFAPENVLLPALDGGLDWEVVYTDTELILKVISAGILPGDYNNDGIVSAADYVVWRDHLGSTSSLPNDSTPGVDIGDYGVWKENFGSPLGSGPPASAAVPEPASIAILLATSMGLVGFRLYGH